LRCVRHQASRFCTPERKDRKSDTREETIMNPCTSRLLIVDDNEMNRDMLARRLARKGYEIAVTHSAHDLLERVKLDGTDLALLDIDMPEVSGLDALKTLREAYSAIELPIIMVTAKNQSEDIVKALDLGANDYLTKPIDFRSEERRVGKECRSRWSA